MRAVAAVVLRFRVRSVGAAEIPRTSTAGYALDETVDGSDTGEPVTDESRPPPSSPAKTVRRLRPSNPTPGLAGE
jgi:hypothetical protein